MTSAFNTKRLTLNKSFVYVAAFTFFVSILSACSNTARIFKNFGRQIENFEEIILLNDHSPLSAYLNFSPETTYTNRESFTLPQNNVRIYIEGDGNVLTNGKPSQNPTSAKLIALNLMQLDKQKSIYLTRPCYGLKNIPSVCQSKFWTDHRYSVAVVKQMNKALDELKVKLQITNFTLIGHSGGGSLAIIIAAHRNDVTQVVTVAANVDHSEWTSQLKVKPIKHSLNAVNFLPLDKKIRQIHFVGGKDTIVPASITRHALMEDKNAKVILKKNFDHHCCWKDLWPELSKNF